MFEIRRGILAYTQRVLGKSFQRGTLTMQHKLLIGLLAVVGLCVGCALQHSFTLPDNQSLLNRVASNSAVPSSLWYLHGSGAYHNPPVLSLSVTPPSYDDTKYKDSTGVHFSGGNPWTEIGVWGTDASLVHGTITGLSDLHVWCGLKNSDDVGTHFDIRAEVWQDYPSGALIGYGETYNIDNLVRPSTNAQELTIPFTNVIGTEFNGTSNILGLRVLARIGTDGQGHLTGGHANATGIRTYFDSVDRNARFTIVTDSLDNFEWARTWGDGGNVTCNDVATDSSGNIYAIGVFSGTVDFDPSAGETVYTSSGDSDVFLTKFNSSGVFLWIKTWGSTSGGNYGLSVTVDVAENIYVTGMARGLVDFDPGSGTTTSVPPGIVYTFLSKFDSSGEFIWVRTWGGGTTIGYAVTTSTMGSSDSVYVAGEFEGSTDFDTGMGEYTLISNGSYDAFLTKFNSEGEFSWVRTWGGNFVDLGSEVVADESGDIYVVGEFGQSVDFNPGTGEDLHTSNGGYDIFLSKFDVSGNFLWAQTWGGSGQSDDNGSVAVDMTGNVYVAGRLERGTIDLNPGSGEDNYVLNATYGAFLSKLGASGNFLWARTWGGEEYDSSTWSNDIATDGLGTVYVTGVFRSGTVDFDPGVMASYRTPIGLNTFMSKFGSDGDFSWVNTWTTDEVSAGLGASAIAVHQGSIYVTGGFRGADVDFNPGVGVDEHTCTGNFAAFLSKFVSE